MQKHIKSVLVFVTLIGLVAFALLSGGKTVSAQAGTPQWSAVIALSGDQALYAQQTSEKMSIDLQSKGVTALQAGGELLLSGSQGQQQLNSALFDDSAAWVDFLGGPVELTLALPVSAAPVTLRLQARITAGYQWQVLNASQAGYSLNAKDTYERRYGGLGVPYIQTIQLQPNGGGDGILRLAYRRSFEPDKPWHAHLQISLAETVGVIEISDPSPTAPVAGPNNDSNQAGMEAYDAITPQTLPTSYDTRPLGIVPAIRDQGGCGGCWAFGTVGVMESAIKKGGGPMTDLSEQFLISCNKDGFGCDGGLTASMYHVNTLGKAQTAVGAVLETVKPYTQTNGTCTIALAHPYKASSWQFIVPNEFTMPTVDQIKNAIYTYGPVTAGVCVGPEFEAYTPGTVFATDETDFCNGGTNHQIVLVGWNDATQSWILRNSWNTSWGNGGYMNIKWGTSRVGEGTSWVKYVGTSSTVPVTYTPAGNTYSVKPTYTWSRIAGAASYKLRVKDVAAGSYPINGVVVPSTACNITTNRCSYTPTTALTLSKNYQWQVAAGAGAYSALKAFIPMAGFNSQFNGSAAGWVKRPGGAWANTATTYYTNGAANLVSSASYNNSFTNFTVQARMKQVSTSKSSTGLVVRGTPLFDADNDWKTAYEFLYDQDGYFSVWKGVNGSWTTLKTWTSSAAIVRNGWNTLKVTVQGSQMRYYINGTLVWSGADAAITSGQVGLWTDRAAAAEKFEADWMTLGMSDYYKSARPQETGQVEDTILRDRFGHPLP